MTQSVERAFSVAHFCCPCLSRCSSPTCVPMLAAHACPPLGDVFGQQQTSSQLSGAEAAMVREFPAAAVGNALLLLQCASMQPWQRRFGHYLLVSDEHCKARQRCWVKDCCWEANCTAVYGRQQIWMPDRQHLPGPDVACVIRDAAPFFKLSCVRRHESCPALLRSTQQHSTCTGSRPKPLLHVLAARAPYSWSVAPVAAACSEPTPLLPPSSMPPLLHAASWLMYAADAPGYSWTDWGMAALGAW